MQKIKHLIVATGILTTCFFVGHCFTRGDHSAFCGDCASGSVSSRKYGIDVGILGNITNQDFVGIGVAAGFNATHGDTRILGLQLAGVGNFNTNKTSVYGVQAAQRRHRKLITCAL